MARRDGLPALLAALGVILLAARGARAQCFRIDGSSPDQSFEPCNPSAEVSACCASNKARPDLCLTSGLCYAQDSGFEGLLFSNGCTDRTGRASGCPSFCPPGGVDASGAPVRSWNVLQCTSGGVYCCRAATDSRNCCGNQTARITADIGQLVLPTRTVGAGATATVTTPAGGSNCNNNNNNNSCPKDNSAVVGGAVGGVLGAALLASLVAVVFLLRRQRRQDGAPPGPAPQYQQADYYGAGARGAAGAYAGGRPFADPMGSATQLTGASGETYTPSSKYAQGSVLSSPQELHQSREVYEMQGNQVR